MISITQNITEENLFFSAQLNQNNIHAKHFYDEYDYICWQEE